VSEANIWERSELILGENNGSQIELKKNQNGGMLRNIAKKLNKKNVTKIIYKWSS